MMNNIFEGRLIQDGRGGFNVTLRRLGIIVIVFISLATSTSPFNQATALASLIQGKQTSIIKNILSVNRDSIPLRVLDPTSFSTHEVKIEASLGDLLKNPEYKNFKKIKVIGKARMVKVSPNSSQIAQVVWNQVSLKNKGKLQTQSLHKPLTSSFKLRSPYLKAGSALKAQGNIQALLEDAQKLLNSEYSKSTKGSDNDLNEGIEQPQGVLNTERRVDDASSEGRARHGNQRRSLTSEELSLQEDSLLTETTSLGAKGSTPPGAGSPKAPPGSKATGQSHQNSDKASQLANFNASSQGQRHRHSPTSLSSNPAFPGSTGSRGSDLRSGDSTNAQGSTRLGNQSSAPTDISSAPITLPRIEVRLTQEGCTPRVDFAQGRVIIQSRSQTFQDGTMIQESPCSDTFDTYPIKKDYRCEDCTDIVDHENRVAYARYRYYWIDDSSRRHEISTHVETDDTRPYPFIEEPGLCAPELDIPHKLAYRQAETVYFNRTNGRIKVAECHRLQGSQPIPMSLTAQGCTPVHDFAAKTSKERKRLVFQMDSSEHEALPCHEVGSSLIHEFVTSVCTPIHDLSRNLVTSMARRRIRTSQGLEFITEECEPYGQSLALQSTAQGCEGEYHHDYDDGKSYIKQRWYHTLSGTPTYVTGCLRSDAYLVHQIAVKGYQHDDGAKTSKPKTAISIIPPHGQPLEISRPQVRPTSQPIPYVYVREEQRPSRLPPRLEGDYLVTPMEKVQIYRRADNSLFKLAAGAGTSVRVRITQPAVPPQVRVVQAPPPIVQTPTPPVPEVPQREAETAHSEEYKVDWHSPLLTSHGGSYTYKDYTSANLSYGHHSHMQKVRLFTRRTAKTRTKITYSSGRVEYTDWQEGPSSNWTLMKSNG
jgi:hypothetical protein